MSDMTLDEAVDVLRPLGPATTNALVAAVVPKLGAMRLFDTNGETSHVLLSERHVIPALVVQALTDLGYTIVAPTETP